jgi:hypothetical protein
MREVLSSAAEAELGAFFHKGKESVPTMEGKHFLTPIIVCCIRTPQRGQQTLQWSLSSATMLLQEHHHFAHNNNELAGLVWWKQVMLRIHQCWRVQMLSMHMWPPTPLWWELLDPAAAVLVLKCMGTDVCRSMQTKCTYILCPIIHCAGESGQCRMDKKRMNKPFIWDEGQQRRGGSPFSVPPWLIPCRESTGCNGTERWWRY